jgi:hypothetical protein
MTWRSTTRAIIAIPVKNRAVMPIPVVIDGELRRVNVEWV